MVKGGDSGAGGGGQNTYDWNGYSCVLNASGGGQYPSLSACLAAHPTGPPPPNPTYDWDGVKCVLNSAGTGQYASLTACQTAHPSGGGGGGVYNKTSGVIKTQASPGGNYAKQTGVIKTQQPTGSGKVQTGVIKTTPAFGSPGRLTTGIIVTSPSSSSGLIGSQPLQNCDDIKPTSPTDIVGWFAYFQCLLTNTFVGLGNNLTGIGDSIAIGLTKGLTTIVQPLQASFSALESAIGGFFKDPTSWLKSLVVGLYAKQSFSIAQTFIDGAINEVDDFLTNLQELELTPIRDWFNAQIQYFFNKYDPQVQTLLSTSPTDAKTLAAQIEKLISDFTADMLTIELPAEFVPFVSISAFNEMDAQIRALLGIDILRDLYVSSQTQAGISEFMRQQANASQQQNIPDMATLNLGVEQGRIDETKYADLWRKASGMVPDYATMYRSLLHQPPGLQDIIQWNLRYPSDQYKLVDLANLLGIDYARYGRVFEERKYTDISIRILRTLYQAQAITIADVDFSILRAGYRSTTLPGQSKSDFQAMHDYIVGFQENTVLAKALQAKEQLYVKGIASRQDLATIAAQVYLDNKELDSFMSSADDKRTLFLEPTKTIPLSLLEKMVKAKVADITFANSQIDLYRFPPDVTQVYKAYFLSLVGTSGT